MIAIDYINATTTILIRINGFGDQKLSVKLNNILHAIASSPSKTKFLPNIKYQHQLFIDAFAWQSVQVKQFRKSSPNYRKKAFLESQFT